jgi:hypothetical protein
MRLGDREQARPPGDRRDPVASAEHLAAARRAVQAQRLDLAADLARRAAESDPSNTEAFAYWGVSAAELGRFADALAPLQTAVARAPPGEFGWANLTSQLARALSNVGFWSDAHRHALALERLAPDDALIRCRLGAVFARIGLVERGLAHLEWAAQAAQADAEPQFELGVAYLTLGRVAEAEARLARAMALAPNWPRPLVALAAVRRWTPSDAHVERIGNLLRGQPAGSPERASLGFALFKELDDLGRFEEAWPVLEAANEAARAQEPPWSAEEDAALTDALIERFPAALFDRRQGAEATPTGGRTPIFVLGLPRSGTTLVERILAAHSRVVSIGEAPTFPLLLRAASTAADRRELTAAVIAATHAADWAALARRYLEETAYLAQGAVFTVDKLPLNSLLVGALRLAFPEAPIVLLKRSPMDVLFSAYRLQFSGLYRWSCRLEDLAGHCASHGRLMDHWRACLGEGLIEVDYEELVRAPQANIARLLEACGLAFEPGCLSPHEASGAVRTASITQIRRPITASGIGAWRRYETQLSPLRDLLQALRVTT